MFRYNEVYEAIFHFVIFGSALFPEMHLITNVAVVTAACTASLIVGKSMHELLPVL